MMTLGTNNATFTGLGVKLDGTLVHVARRLAYLYRMPTLNHQLKVGFNWSPSYRREPFKIAVKADATAENLWCNDPKSFSLMLLALFGKKAVWARSMVTWLWCRSSTEALDRVRPKFSSSPPPIFPGIEPQRFECEFEWWRVVSLCTFKQVGVVEQFADFSAFFTALYIHLLLVNPGLFIQMFAQF